MDTCVVVRFQCRFDEGIFKLIVRDRETAFDAAILETFRQVKELPLLKFLKWFLALNSAISLNRKSESNGNRGEVR